MVGSFLKLKKAKRVFWVSINLPILPCIFHTSLLFAGCGSELPVHFVIVHDICACIFRTPSVSSCVALQDSAEPMPGSPTAIRSTSKLQGSHLRGMHTLLTSCLKLCSPRSRTTARGLLGERLVGNSPERTQERACSSLPDGC